MIAKLFNFSRFSLTFSFLKGFGTHPHRDMEIITYVIEGNLTHQDSMGTQETLSNHSVQVGHIELLVDLNSWLFQQLHTHIYIWLYVYNLLF
jgi:hypothetical protein